MTEESKPAVKKSARAKNLTTAQKAEAVALWRTGTVTLEDLAKKFKKRPEAFSRMFSRMGVGKGSSDDIKARAKKIEEDALVKAVSSVSETLKRINDTKEDHFRYSAGLSKLAWSELVRARQAGLDIAGLKDLMATLKLAGDVFAGTRKEIFTILNVEKHERAEEFDDLPELTVRELTQSEIGQLQTQIADTDDMGLGDDVGAEMMPDDTEEGL
jgi:hypothetical protein